MKRPAFSEGVIVAIVVSLAITVLFTVLSSFLPTRWLLQGVIATVSFTYIFYLLIRSQEKVGRVTVIMLWGVVSVLAWLLAPSTIIVLFVHVGMIWLVRALYYYTSLIVALLDLGLTLFAMAAAIWTLSYTHSLFLSVWCFFLIQAVFVMLPADLKAGMNKSKQRPTGQQPVESDVFEQAYQSAQTALRQITTYRP